MKTRQEMLDMWTDQEKYPDFGPILKEYLDNVEEVLKIVSMDLIKLYIKTNKENKKLRKLLDETLKELDKNDKITG